MDSVKLFLEPTKNPTAIACNVNGIGIHETMKAGFEKQFKKHFGINPSNVRE